MASWPQAAEVASLTRCAASATAPAARGTSPGNQEGPGSHSHCKLRQLQRLLITYRHAFEKKLQQKQLALGNLQTVGSRLPAADVTCRGMHLFYCCQDLVNTPLTRQQQHQFQKQCSSTD